MNRRPVKNDTEPACAACETNLATCDTIWAAEGILYCSRECGISDFENEYGVNAERFFDAVAEEINPRDIGLVDTDVCTNCSDELPREDLYKTSRGQMCFDCIKDIIKEGIEITIYGRL